MKVFELKGESIALCDLLKITGLCQTGGQAKIMISEGLVEVDGKTELTKRRKIKSGQKISYDGTQLLIK